MSTIDSANGICKAVHLRDLNAVFDRYPPDVDMDGRKLINFMRYIKYVIRLHLLYLGSLFVGLLLS
jgi:hypothetical protein